MHNVGVVSMSSSISIRRLTVDDLDFAEELRRLAGWNQRRCDWQRLLDYEPEGCFLGLLDGRPVGTVTTTTYGVDLAWIGMMLVHPDYRRRGIATVLMEQSLDELRRRGVRCIKLDATPAGQPVYERLGFRAEWDFHRWEGTLGDGTADAPAPVVHFGEIDPRQLVLDRCWFGADRTEWLTRLALDSTVIQDEHGFGMCRDGAVASYLGPVVAADRDGAERMIRGLLSVQAQRVASSASEDPAPARRIFWDIPGPNHAAIELAESLGFQPVRPLLRMWTGETCLVGRADLQYALADPGTG